LECPEIILRLKKVNKLNTLEKFFKKKRIFGDMKQYIIVIDKEYQLGIL